MNNGPFSRPCCSSPGVTHADDCAAAAAYSRLTPGETASAEVDAKAPEGAELIGDNDGPSGNSESEQVARTPIFDCSNHSSDPQQESFAAFARRFSAQVTAPPAADDMKRPARRARTASVTVAALLLTIVIPFASLRAYATLMDSNRDAVAQARCEDARHQFRDAYPEASGWNVSCTTDALEVVADGYETMAVTDLNTKIVTVRVDALNESDVWKVMSHEAGHAFSYDRLSADDKRKIANSVEADSWGANENYIDSVEEQWARGYAEWFANSRGFERVNDQSLPSVPIEVVSEYRK